MAAWTAVACNEPATQQCDLHAGQGRGDLEAAGAAAVRQALAGNATGDVLCFLPGAGEIRRLQAMWGCCFHVYFDIVAS